MFNTVNEKFSKVIVIFRGKTIIVTRKILSAFRLYIIEKFNRKKMLKIIQKDMNLGKERKTFELPKF